MTADRVVTVVPGHGLFVPESLAALLAEELRYTAVAELRQLRAAAHAVAVERTARRLRTVAADRYVDVPQAAEMLSVTAGAVRQLIHSGAIKGAEKTEGRWRIPRDAVERRMHGKRSRTGGRARPAS